MQNGSKTTDVRISVSKNGPYLVTGSIELMDGRGNAIATDIRTALCRCGGSMNKPFCDGTHAKVGFHVAEEATSETSEQGVIAEERIRRALEGLWQEASASCISRLAYTLEMAIGIGVGRNESTDTTR